MKGCQKRQGWSGLPLPTAPGAALAPASQAERVPAPELRKPPNESLGVCPRTRGHPAQWRVPGRPALAIGGRGAALVGEPGSGKDAGQSWGAQSSLWVQGGEGKAGSPAQAPRLLCCWKAGCAGLDHTSQFGKSRVESFAIKLLARIAKLWAVLHLETL